MLAALAIAALVLTAGNVVVALAIVARRWRVAALARRRDDAEARLGPVALDLIDGELAVPPPLGDRDTVALAAVLARYSRHLRGDARDRIRAAFEAGDAIERQIAQLGARRDWRRATAARALGDIASPRGRGPLIAALGDRSREVRTAASRALGRVGGVEAVEPLTAAMTRGAVPAAAAGHALMSIGPAALPALRVLTLRPGPETRAAAVELVGLLGGASDVVVVAPRLRDRSPAVRAAAAAALGRLGDPAPGAALAEALGDRDAGVRAAAARALGALDDAGAAPALAAQSLRDAPDPARAAAEALLRVHPGAAAEAARAPGGIHVAEAIDLAAARGAA